MVEIYVHFQTKTALKPYPFGPHISTYLTYKRKYPPDLVVEINPLITNLLVNQNIAKKPKHLVKTWKEGSSVFVKIYHFQFSELEFLWQYLKMFLWPLETILPANSNLRRLTL